MQFLINNNAYPNIRLSDYNDNSDCNIMIRNDQSYLGYPDIRVFGEIGIF